MLGSAIRCKDLRELEAYQRKDILIQLLIANLFLMNWPGDHSFRIFSKLEVITYLNITMFNDRAQSFMGNQCTSSLEFVLLHDSKGTR